MTTERISISAIDSSNVFVFPTFQIQQLWDRKIHIHKEYLRSRFGADLFGIRIVNLVSSPTHRNFDVISSDLGLGPPLNSKVRFLISDEPISAPPTTADADQLLVAVELGGSYPQWTSHPKFSHVTLVKTPLSGLVDVLSDVVMDIAFCNSFAMRAEIQAIRSSGCSMREFYRRKSDFANREAAYTSYSNISRGNDKFGSEAHLDRFIAIWDKFLVKLLASVPEPRNSTSRIVANYPGFRNQISSRRIGRAVKDLPVGTNVLFVRRRAEGGVSRKFQNKIDTFFSSLPVVGGGKKSFGFSFDGRLGPEAQEMIRNRAAYAVRMHVGG